jgi:hypothetical protein
VTSAPGLISRAITSARGGWAAISRASSIPATSESTSSGSDSELVRIPGLESGSADRSQTEPRDFVEISTGAIVSAWPSNSSPPWSSK